MSPRDLQDSTKNTETNQSEKTVRVGRPKKYDTEQTVQRRNIRVTDATWDALEKITEHHGLGSRSELLEQIGRDKLKVVNTLEETKVLSTDDELSNDEIPVLPRLRSLLQKTAYLKSILSFSRLVAISVGLSKDRYDKEEIIEKVVINAVIFVALRDYAYPDYIVSSALADIRWLIFEQLISKAGININENSTKSLQSKSNFKKLELDRLSESIQKIFYSIYLLSTNHPSEYQIYKMRMMEGLTWEQIYRLLKLKNQDTTKNVTKEDIRLKNHKAVADLRDIWHSPEMKIDNIENIKKNGKFQDIFNCLSKSLSIAEEYYTFITKIFSNLPDQKLDKDKESEHITQWEDFLVKAMNDPTFDLLLPEIHHDWAHKDETIDMKEYLFCQDRIIDNINNKFEPQLKERLSSLKEKLKLYGTDRQSVRDTLMTFVKTDQNFKFSSTDPNFDIPESIFLGSRSTLKVK
jgi:hypothetical protein